MCRCCLVFGEVAQQYEIEFHGSPVSSFERLQFRSSCNRQNALGCDATPTGMTFPSTHTRASLSAKVHATIKSNDFIHLTQFDIVAAIKPGEYTTKSHSLVCVMKNYPTTHLSSIHSIPLCLFALALCWCCCYLAHTTSALFDYVNNTCCL